MASFFHSWLVSTSSRIAGRAFSNVEYAKDTPLRLVMGVVVGVADMESNTREGGPESRLGNAACIMLVVMQ